MVDTTNFRLDSNQLGHIERRLQNIADAIDRNTAAVKKAFGPFDEAKAPDGSS